MTGIPCSKELAEHVACLADTQSAKKVINGDGPLCGLSSSNKGALLSYHEFTYYQIYNLFHQFSKLWRTELSKSKRRRKISMHIWLWISQCNYLYEREHVESMTRQLNIKSDAISVKCATTCIVICHFDRWSDSLHLGIQHKMHNQGRFGTAAIADAHDYSHMSTINQSLD